MDEKTFWKQKNWDEPEVPDILKISNGEIERRYKISTTSQLKYNTDREFKEIKLKAGRKGAESKRQVPVEDYESIIREYWDCSQLRPIGFAQTIGDRYGVKSGVVEKIVWNRNNTLNDEEFTALRQAYDDRYTRSDIMQQVQSQGLRDNEAAAVSISLAKQSLTGDQALEIYQRCLPYWKQPGAKAFKQQLAKEYGVSYHKINAASMGNNHPVFESAELINKTKDKLASYGSYWFCSPAGKEYNFDNIEKLGIFLIKTEKGYIPDSKEAIRCVRTWFDRTEPNVTYIKERRFWKGWQYKNIR